MSFSPLLCLAAESRGVERKQEVFIHSVASESIDKEEMGIEKRARKFYGLYVFCLWLMIRKGEKKHSLPKRAIWNESPCNGERN